MPVIKAALELQDGKHELKFVHNTITGSRVVSLDGRELHKSGWMYELVGTVPFEFDNLGKKHKGVITIEPPSKAADGDRQRSRQTTLSFWYRLTVDGKTLNRLKENAKITSRNWKFQLDGQEHFVVLEKDVMDVWVDGEVVESKGEFVDDGTETIFQVGGKEACIHTVQSGSAIKQVLYINDVVYPESREARA